MTRVGLDLWRPDGRRYGLLVNQATVDSAGVHVLERVVGDPNFGTLFGPQHGLFGHTQDNMIEWESAPDARLGIPVYSLYGERRQPSVEMLDGLDVLVIDLPDIGSRYYTFAWTMALAMETCANAGVAVVVLDRPNPLGGEAVEGPILDPAFTSFVGLHPVPIRHSMTLGEMSTWVNARLAAPAELEVVRCEGWSREQLFPETGQKWGLPSPNMPTFDTALVYPGACLLEGTHLSEGRGTTRPFEQFGAPWLDAFKFCSTLNELKLPGVRFRPTQFQPTFHKFGGDVCEGAFVQVLNSDAFQPVRTYGEAIRVAHDMWRAKGEPEARFVPTLGGAGAWEGQTLSGFWKQPPYEYEFEKAPIDILWGSPGLRDWVEGRGPAPFETPTWGFEKLY